MMKTNRRGFIGGMLAAGSAPLLFGGCAGMFKGNSRINVAGGCRKAEPVPATFDYETWLGPTDHNVAYNWTRCHNQDLAHISDRPGWIQLAPYGWGMITNWGAHHLDIARWGLGALGPESVAGTCEWMDLSGDKLWNVHTKYDLHYAFNRGATDVHVCDRYQNGVKFVGGKRGQGLTLTSPGAEPILSLTSVSSDRDCVQVKGSRR